MSPTRIIIAGISYLLMLGALAAGAYYAVATVRCA